VVLPLELGWAERALPLRLLVAFELHVPRQGFLPGVPLAAIGALEVRSGPS